MHCWSSADLYPAATKVRRHRPPSRAPRLLIPPRRLPGLRRRQLHLQQRSGGQRVRLLPMMRMPKGMTTAMRRGATTVSKASITATGMTIHAMPRTRAQAVTEKGMTTAIQTVTILVRQYIMRADRPNTARKYGDFGRNTCAVAENGVTLRHKSARRVRQTGSG